ncbi:Uncharacterised protein [uncultured archaeon]|nr:Uncharacterised protein [uncultured archaeon]
MEFKDLLWGEELKEGSIYEELFLKGDYKEGQAKKVLESIIHPEIRFIIQELQNQIGQNKNLAEFDARKSSREKFSYICASIGLPMQLNVRQAFLFTEITYENGIYDRFIKLLEAANPEYKSNSDTNELIRLVRN